MMILAMMAALSLAAMDEGPKPAQRARANLNQYFSTDDYPPTALRRGAVGTVHFKLEIDPDGWISKCTILHSSGDAALDAATCSILLGRARYEPARDAAGRAVAGRDEGRVTWRLPPPNEQGMPFAPTRVVSRLHADGSGGLVCTVIADGQPAEEMTPARCGTLTGSDVEYAMRHLQSPADLTTIFAAGPAGPDVDDANPEERGFGTLQLDLVVDLTVAPDGHVTACSVVRRYERPGGTVRRTPDLCARAAASTHPMYQPSAARGPRNIHHRLALYVLGGPGEQQTPPSAAPGTPRS